MAMYDPAIWRDDKELSQDVQVEKIRKAVEKRRRRIFRNFSNAATIGISITEEEFIEKIAEEAEIARLSL